MNTSTIGQADRALRRRRDDNAGPLCDVHALPTPRRAAADDPGGASRPTDRHDQPRYRVCPGHLPITGLTIAGRILIADLPPDTTAARHQRGATAYLGDISREPNRFTSHLLNLTVGAGRSRIEVRHCWSQR
jgi:hypothetical protein